MRLHCHQADFRGAPVLIELSWVPVARCYSMSITWLDSGQEIDEDAAAYYCDLFETRPLCADLDVYLTQLASLGITLPHDMIDAVRHDRAQSASESIGINGVTLQQWPEPRRGTELGDLSI